MEKDRKFNGRTLFTQGFPADINQSVTENLSGQLVRPLSSVVEHAVHIGGVASSKLAAATTFSTTHKGDVAELMAAAELMRRGYRVSRPLSNGAPYDLIVDDGTRLYRVQVKKASHVEGGLRINLCSSKHHRGRSRVLYKGTCDAVVAVDCERHGFYAFGEASLGVAEIRLRLTPPRNNQAAGVNLAEHFDLSWLFPVQGGAR
jgi:hypothetical protein